MLRIRNIIQMAPAEVIVQKQRNLNHWTNASRSIVVRFHTSRMMVLVTCALVTQEPNQMEENVAMKYVKEINI